MEATIPAAGADEAARRAGRPPPGRVGAWIRAKRRGEGPLVGPTSATVHAHGVARPDRGFPAGPLRTAGVDRGAPAGHGRGHVPPSGFLHPLPPRYARPLDDSRAPERHIPP